MPPSVQDSIRDIGKVRLRLERRTLHFRTPARTSRSSLTTRNLFYIHAQTENGTGTGECCPLPRLSPEERNGTKLPNALQEACSLVERQNGLRPGQWSTSPAIRFGLESALLAALHPGKPRWDTPFSRGETALSIHHLIWMDTADSMFAHMAQGYATGFRCLKFKVGALPFPEELNLLRRARAAFPQATLRIDANGAFCPGEAMGKLEALAQAGADLIEQPIPPGQRKDLARLCRHSPLPIALDEELIAPTTYDGRARLLDETRPAAIVLKPTLHGGLSGAEEWATLAEERDIRWWANSSLESHIGLTALAEWAALRAPNALHGLGTGRLFLDDTPYPVHLKGHQLLYETAPT